MSERFIVESVPHSALISEAHDVIDTETNLHLGFISEWVATDIAKGLNANPETVSVWDWFKA